MVQIVYLDQGYFLSQVAMVLIIPVVIYGLISIFLSRSLKSKKEILIPKISEEIHTQLRLVTNDISKLKLDKKDSENMDKKDSIATEIYELENRRNELNRYQEWLGAFEELRVRDLEKIDHDLDLFDLIYKKRLSRKVK